MAFFGLPLNEGEPKRVVGKYWTAKCWEGGRFAINFAKTKVFHTQAELDAFLADKAAWGEDSYSAHEHLILQPERWFANKTVFETGCAYQRTLVGLPA